MDLKSTSGLLAALVLLAGCTASAGTQSPNGPAEAVAEAAPAQDVHHYAKTFTFTDTELHTAVGQDAFGNNCLWIQGKDGFQILKGSGKATWTAATPAAASFSLYMMNWPEVVATAEGGSPMTLEFRDPGPLDGQNGFYLLGFELDQKSVAGANLQQQVDFVADFDYVGAEPDVSPNSSCAIGY